LHPGQVVLEGAAGKAIAGLVRLRVIRSRPRRADRGPRVLLANGDVLSIAPLIIDDEHLIGRWPAVAGRTPLRIPLETIAMIRLDDRRPATPTVASPPATDLVVLSNGDRLAGEFERLTDATVIISAGGTRRRVPLSGVREIRFNPQLVSAPRLDGPGIVLGLADGSRLTATGPRTIGDDRLELVPSYGGRLLVPFEEIVSLGFVGGHADFLSDLDPLDVDHTPYQGGRRTLGRDRSIAGNPLVLRGVGYHKGLGATSRMKITRRLDGRHSHFCATVGIDDDARGRGSVVFRVELDGKPVFDSGLVSGRDPPMPVGPIALGAARRLLLVVDYGRRADVLDHADWCDARLVRKRVKK